MSSQAVARPTPIRKARRRMRALIPAVLTVAVSFGGVVAGSAPAGAVVNPLVQGSILSNGSPVVGATVQAIVWPDLATQAALANGAAVPTINVPSVTTASNGSYSIAYNASSLPASYVNDNGDINVELQVTTTAQTSFTFSTTAVSSGWTTTRSVNDGSDSTGALPETVSIDLGKSTATEAGDTTSLAAFRKGAKPATDPSAADAIVSQIVVTPVNAAQHKAMAVPNCVTCNPCQAWIAGSITPDRDEPFAYIHAGSKAPAYAIEHYDSSHSIGIAVSVSGSWTGGSAGGTLTVDMAASGSVLLGGNHAVFNAMNFRDYNNQCGTTHRQGIGLYALLSRIDATTEPPASFDASCTTYHSASPIHLIKHNGTNVTFNSQVSVGPVSVNAQSGWNDSTDEEWVTQSGSTNYLCGNSATLGWVSSPQADMDSA